MPKVPPNEVIRHEIVLGKAERELMRNTLEAYQFNRYADPIVKGLSDVTFTVTVAAILAFFLGKALDELGLDPDWRDLTKDMTPEQISDWLETQNLVGAGIGGILGFLIGGPWGAAIGATAGSATVEAGEYVYDEIEQAALRNDSISRFIRWWQTLDLPAWAQSDGGIGSQGL